MSHYVKWSGCEALLFSVSFSAEHFLRVLKHLVTLKVKKLTPMCPKCPGILSLAKFAENEKIYNKYNETGGREVSRWRNYCKEKEPGSSGSIVSGYGLDDRTVGVRSLAGAKDFSSSLCVQTGSGARPASCTMGVPGVLSQGVKRGRGVMLTTHPDLVPRS
jgi:hypothetical protein